MTALVQDLRFGLRLLVRHRSFSIVTLLVLGAGIGVVTTVASVANALLLRPPAVEEPGTLVRVFSGRYSSTPLLDLMAYQETSSTLSGIAAFREARLSVRIGQGDAQPLFGNVVSGNYFEVLGVKPWRGRTFLLDDVRTPGSAAIAVLSHRAWQRHFDSDPHVLDRPVAINGQPFTIVGIMPESFTGAWGPVAADLWVPVTMHPVIVPGARTFVDRDAFYAQAVARLQPGVTLARAQAELDTRYRQWQAATNAPARERSDIRLYPLHYLVPELWGRAALFLAIVGGLTLSMLAIVCLDVANLMLARNSLRSGEFGVRAAMGAGRGRLVRQLLTESACLGAGGAALGLGFAIVLTRALATWTPPAPVPIVVDVTPDWRVLVATCTVGVLSVILFGLAPAWTLTRRVVAPTPGHGSTRATGAGRTRLRATLLVAQVSLSLLLLVIAGLLVRSLHRAERIDLGFEPDGVLMMALDLDVAGYAPERGQAFYSDLLARVRALPGVDGASLLDVVPLTGSSRGSVMRKDGDPPPAPGRTDGLVTVGRKSIADGHFTTLRIPFLQGRDFSTSDDAAAPAVAIVNETLARTFWPGESPIGRRLRIHDANGPDTPSIEVVGLVRDSRYVSVGEPPRPFLYRPLAQEFSADAALVVRVGGDPMAHAAALRGVVRQIDANLPIFELRTLADATSLSLLPIRIAASVVATLALAVLALAAMGIYGVLSFVVGQRTREFGILMALGADRAAIVSLVLRETTRWLSCGIAVGLALALLAAPLASSLLYGIAPRDVPTLACVVVLLAIVAIGAAFVPARRASRLAPAEALRHD